MTWLNGLRLLVLVGLAWSAWDGWRRLPAPVRLGGRRYHRLADGRWCTAWGRLVADPVVLQALQREAGDATPAHHAADERRP